MRSPRLVLGAAVVFAFAASVGIGAQQGARSADAPDANATIDAGNVNASEVFGQADFQSGGTGLRNQRRGAIMINGVPGGAAGPVLKSYVYWAVITSGAATVAQRTMTVSRLWPPTAAKPVSMTVVGSIVGTAPQPCWSGTTISVLKADVTGVTTGSGLYRVQVKVGGSFAGADPWVSSPGFPLHEGASMVVIYSQAGATTSIYDVGLTTMFSGGLTYTLALPGATSSVKMDLIGADGQTGASRSAGFGTETTTVNGVAIGAGSPWSNSLWNGYSGAPLPQLWDDHGRIFSLSSTAALTVTHTAGGDCLVPIANIVRQP
jgi:hypothetical protein